MSQNQRRAMDPRQVVRTLRLVFAMMLFSLCLYPVVLTQIHDSSITPPDRTFQTIISLVGIVTGSVVLYLRFVRITGLFSPNEPMDGRTLAAQAWTYYILCYLFSETTALFGFALAFMRGDPKFYVPLYLGGVLLMLLCFPRLPGKE